MDCNNRMEQSHKLYLCSLERSENMSVRIFNNRNILYQYDKDQKLIVDDEEIVELHLTNTTLENALCIKCRDENGVKVCDIPNSLLEQSGILTAYAYCKNDGEYTKAYYSFNVSARKKSDDYVEEEDAPRWSDLDKRIEELENHPVSDEKIESLVKAYLEENPVEAEIPSEYVTESELEAKGYLTEHQDLSGYAKKDHAHDAYVTDEELSKKGFLTEHQDLSGYAEKDHTHSQYLTEHQDLSDYALKTEIPTDYATKDFVTEAINNAINVALNTEV